MIDRRSSADPLTGLLRRTVASFAVLVLALAATASAQAEEPEVGISLSVGSSFVEELDLESFRLSAVQDAGRVKTFDSLAREKMKYIVGAREAGKQDPVVVYLDMMLVPQHYVGLDTLFVKKPAIRQRITQMVRSEVPPEGRQGAISDAELERINDTGFVSIRFLDHPTVRGVLARLERDLMTANKEVQKIYDARFLADSQTLMRMWRSIPPPGGDPLDRWLTVGEVLAAGAPRDSAHASVVPGGIPGAPPELTAEIDSAWTALAEAWRFQEAQGASEALDRLAAAFAQVEPALYPSETRRGLEHWYYRNHKLTWSWIVYFLALPPLLLSVVYGFRRARLIGLAIFAGGFVLHTASIAVRWYLAGRVPNANMFEAIVAAAWLGVLVAIVMEWILRRWPYRGLPALAASAGAMTAMMVGHFLPVTLSSDITTVTAVLDRTIWLYIHTNIVIASYALIFFASVTAALYLILRGLHAVAPTSMLGRRWLPAGEAGHLGYAGAGAGGGAASIILGRGRGADQDGQAGLARVLDGTTMIFLELAFVTLWFGTILGAAWADVSWGRPWGWDPKEVFALNTWIVFLVLVHVRLKAKDKGYWTAVLAVIGCLVMLFNWIVVNFVIVGLHSYA